MIRSIKKKFSTRRKQTPRLLTNYDLNYEHKALETYICIHTQKHIYTCFFF